MATTGLYANTGLATLYDMAARLGKDGKEADQRVVELQAQTNDIWTVLPFKPCNDGTKEKIMLRNDLPDVAWRMLNSGSMPDKSAVKQASYTTGGLEALAEIDERMLAINRNSNVWRLSENTAHQEAMSQKMCQTIFYGDEKINPAGFTGFSAHYYSKANQDALYADQIIDAGGTAEDKLTSLWIMTFGMDTVYGIHPETIPTGYRYKDNGRIQMMDAAGGKFWGYQSQYNWDMGIAIRDPRYIVRLANIDLTQTSSTTFIDSLITAFNQIHNPDHGRTVILCNRKVETYLAILAAKKENVNLRIDEFGGKKITHFWTAPILRNDAILTTEERLV